jgi:spermidine/putrescine-binding protein
MPANSKFILGRRGLIAAAAVSPLARPSIARAEPVSLVLGTNGGEEYKVMYEAVYSGFEKKYNAKIVPVYGDSATLLNKVLAERANPSMDAVITYQGGWDIGKAEGVFEKVDFSAIPNSDKVY